MDLYLQDKSLISLTLYATLRRRRDGNMRRVDTSDWEVETTANQAHYAVALTGTAAGAFSGSVPAGITTIEDLLIIYWIQVGAGPVWANDTIYANQEIPWSGTATVDLTNPMVITVPVTIDQPVIVRPGQ